jgi:hypothetical protein
VASLKRKLEVAGQKSKDDVDDLQAVVEGKFAWSLNIESMHVLGLFLILSTLGAFRRQGDRGQPQEGACGD